MWDNERYARADLERVPAPVDVAQVTARHERLMAARLAFVGLAEHAPQELPGILTTLDVRIVIGDDAPRTRLAVIIAEMPAVATYTAHEFFSHVLD